MKIIKIKKNNNKYKITLENNKIIETYDEVIIKNNILYKKEIDDNLIKIIEEENKYYDIYNDIIKYINKKIRSIKELKEYMNKKEVNLKLQEKLITDLKNKNLINDNLYVKAYIHDKLLLSNYGINKIKENLLKLDLNENIIEEEINKIDPEDQQKKLEKMIIKKVKSNTKYSDKIMKQKIINYFINLGYNKEDIIEILEKNNINNTEIIKKEYDKLYNKYKTKYDNAQLEYTIKQKLFQKGFTIDEINNIVK